ncbi:MAG TPA: hypothetical protein VNT53_01090 [Pseudolysinimonas sp.]|nr:hypothetical protein [Pseudolysinimonas sp.]
MTDSDDSCPPWCVADHRVEDERGRHRHRGATAAVAGVVRGPHGDAESAELLLELHHDDPQQPIWVFVGDGERVGFDMSFETATQLHRRLGFVLAEPGMS